MTSWSRGMNSDAISRAGLRKYLRRSRATTAQAGRKRLGSIRASGVERALVVAQLVGGVAQVPAGEVDEHVLERASPQGQRGDGDPVLARRAHEAGQRRGAVAAVDAAHPPGQLHGV